MSVLKDLIDEFNEMVLPLWVFPQLVGQRDETIPCLFTVIRKVLLWATERERCNPAV